MDYPLDFLNQLSIQLECYPKFENWKHLEQLTAICAQHIIQHDARYTDWQVEYDEDTHKFPDVIIRTPVANWGIEVKSSQSKNWETLGGSINESTKVLGLDAIFILFGKNSAEQIQIKIKEFSQCIKSVAVTHSPRYLIDMELEHGQDLFSLLNTSYVSVCQLKQPFDIFKNYFKEKAKKSKTTFWFLSDEESERTSESYQHLEWKFFNQLEKSERSKLIAEAIVLYPVDLFGYSRSRYDQCNVFFLGRNVISNSMRDNFSAGGQYQIEQCLIPQKYSLLVNDEILAAIHELLSTEPTIEMQKLYQSHRTDLIKAAWLQAIESALSQALDDQIKAVILRKIRQTITL